MYFRFGLVLHTIISNADVDDFLQNMLTHTGNVLNIQGIIGLCLSHVPAQMSWNMSGDPYILSAISLMAAHR
jgi:hypothetical protein